MQRDLANADATRAFGEELAHILKAGDVLLLSGELGAGKTTLVQGLAWGLGLPRDQYAQSPTYAIALTYPTTPRLHHLDLYRLDSGAGDLLGDDYFAEDAITVIEWPEKAPAWLPSRRYELRLSIEGDARKAYLVRGNAE